MLQQHLVEHFGAAFDYGRLNHARLATQKREILRQKAHIPGIPRRAVVRNRIAKHETLNLIMICSLHGRQIEKHFQNPPFSKMTLVS